MSDVPSFGTWLKRRRKALDLTQDALAQRVGCSVVSIRKFEGDSQRPSRQLAELLAQQLAIPPDERTTFIQFARQGLDAAPPGLPLPAGARLPTPHAPPLAPLLPNNLPIPPTSLIGRTQDITAVCARLRREDARLLTLSGPGGSGKTRLAIQVATELCDDFGDRVYFVNLAPLSDPALVMSTIMQTLGVREQGQQTAHQQLQAYLRDKQLLLVLDNFEQVVDAAPRVAELLAAAPQLKVLVTSRVVLHVRGEQEYPVPPLALPDRRHLPALESVSQYAAVALFIARAQAVKPDFAVTNANAPAVADICVRLDGLPLAIELAAARIKLFAPEALLARLSSGLKLLTGGPRDLPERQQTIRNTIDWSYQLLDVDQQRLFARLGVFVGGCTLEAAEEVCNADGDLPIQMLDGLAALVDKSLLKQEAGVAGEPRFSMLETIREYVLERLEESGETNEMLQRHAKYFVALAETAEPELQSPALRMWLSRLEADYDNLHATLARSLLGKPQLGIASREALELGLRLAGALDIFWRAHNRQREARVWIEASLERNRTIAASLPPSVRMKALNTAGSEAVSQSDHTRATALLEESLTLAREIGDQIGIGTALVELGRVARLQGDYGQAERLEKEGLALFRSEGDASNTTHALVSLSDAALERGALDRATIYLQEALAICQDMGFVGESIWATYNLGRVAHLQGNHPRALSLLEESLARFREVDYTRGVRQTLTVLGRVARAQGYGSTAAEYFAESLALVRETPFSETLIAALEGLAGVAAAQGQPERAARLFGAAEAERTSVAMPLPPAYRAAYERDVAAAHAQLDEATFAAAWAAGRALTPEQAIAYALYVPLAGQPHQTGAGVVDEPPQPVGVAPDRLSTLTARERQVLALLAQGASNRAIADTLVIAERTAEIDVSNILSKLGVTSRTQAAAYALAQGLIAPADG
jgi:predicted ATPase/DNA-binding CsgD family transcriptional regulator/transcriptional regulator with XRE-family HTH domain